MSDVREPGSPGEHDEPGEPTGQGGKGGRGGEGGYRGDQGEQGEQGKRGGQGETGGVGETGEQGEQGERGERGRTSGTHLTEKRATALFVALLLIWPVGGLILQGRSTDKLNRTAERVAVAQCDRTNVLRAYLRVRADESTGTLKPSRKAKPSPTTLAAPWVLPILDCPGTYRNRGVSVRLRAPVEKQYTRIVIDTLRLPIVKRGRIVRAVPFPGPIP